MATRNSRIVVLKQDVDVSAFAESVVKSAQVVDSVAIMATEFEPEEKTVQSSPELGYFVANMTQSEEKKLADDPNVESIEDDIEVYALSDESDGFDDAVPVDDDESSMLELDDEDIEALEAEPYPELEPDELPFAPGEAELMATLIGEIEDDPEFDETGQLMRVILDGEGPITAEGLSGDLIVRLVKCLLKCAIEEIGRGGEVSDDKIAELLRGSGIGDAATTVRAAADFIPWGVAMLRAPAAWRFSTGAGVRVAVVDTGIAQRHPDLRVHGGVSYVPGRRSFDDDNGHGTHVAGTIAALRNRRGVVGVAPNARLYAVKVLNRAGRGRLSAILNGLSWCYRRRMHVVNLSLGSAERTHDTGVYSRAYERAGQRLRQRGILAVAAAGNSNGPVGNPARCPSYMAVSAIDQRRRRASFSCFGPQVEICAPGVAIPSTYPPNGYRSLRGTSMASPHVAGAAALVKARHPGWHGDRVRVHLWRTALDLGKPRRDPFFGFGMARALRAVR